MVQYEEKLVVYIDILGWANKTNQNTINSSIINSISYFNSKRHFCSKANRERIQDEAKAKKWKLINNSCLDMECSFFSDNIIISMPIDFNDYIFVVSGDICREILIQGFLTRGSVTKGLLYHKENIVFGPALNEAVALEKEAIYPRILCSNQLITYMQTWNKQDDPITLTDVLGRTVVNPFPLLVELNHPEALALQENQQHIPEISQLIDENVKKFSEYQDFKKLEKWKYMGQLLQLARTHLRPNF